MGKIQGYIGQQDPMFSVVQVGYSPTKYRKQSGKRFLVVSRYKTTSNKWVFVEMPLPEELLGNHEEIKKYFSLNFRKLGKLTGDSKNWDAGTINTETKRKGNKPAARGRIKTDFNVLIGGDLHFKTQQKIRQIIRQGEAANEEFFKTILA